MDYNSRDYAYRLVHGFLVARGNPQPPDLNDSSDDINLQNNIIKSYRYIKDIHL